MGNWYSVYTNSPKDTRTKEQKKQDWVKADRAFRRAMKMTKSLKLEEMKKHGDEAYDIKIMQENCLLDAYKEKKLKSKNLIKQAKKIKKRRAEAASKDLKADNEVVSESVSAE